MQNELNSLIHEAAIKLDAREFQEAESIYEEALKLQKGNAAALMGLAMIYNRTSRPKEAEKLLSSLLALFQPAKRKRGKKLIPTKKPSNQVMATLYTQLGVAHFLLDEKDKALTMYKKALTLMPSKEIEYMISSVQNPQKKLSPQQILLREANAFLKLNKIDEAQFILKKALRKYPSDAELLYLMALSFRQAKDPKKALPFLQQAIMIDPEKAFYYNDLGMIFHDMQEYAKAVKFYKRALSRDPNYALSYSNMGVAYKKLEQPKEAIEAYKKALEIDQNLAAAHNNLGNLLRFTGDTEGAKEHLEQALQINPNYEDARKNLEELGEE